MVEMILATYGITVYLNTGDQAQACNRLCVVEGFRTKSDAITLSLSAIRLQDLIL